MSEGSILRYNVNRKNFQCKFTFPLAQIKDIMKDKTAIEQK